jgi:hypothetical protein
VRANSRELGAAVAGVAGVYLITRGLVLAL